MDINSNEYSNLYNKLIEIQKEYNIQSNPEDKIESVLKNYFDTQAISTEGGRVSPKRKRMSVNCETNKKQKSKANLNEEKTDPIVSEFVDKIAKCINTVVYSLRSLGQKVHVVFPEKTDSLSETSSHSASSVLCNSNLIHSLEKWIEGGKSIESSNKFSESLERMKFLSKILENMNEFHCQLKEDREKLNIILSDTQGQIANIGRKCEVSLESEKMKELTPLCDDNFNQIERIKGKLYVYPFASEKTVITLSQILADTTKDIFDLTDNGEGEEGKWIEEEVRDRVGRLNPDIIPYFDRHGDVPSIGEQMRMMEEPASETLPASPLINVTEKLEHFELFSSTSIEDIATCSIMDEEKIIKLYDDSEPDRSVDLDIYIEEFKECCTELSIFLDHIPDYNDVLAKAKPIFTPRLNILKNLSNDAPKYQRKEVYGVLHNYQREINILSVCTGDSSLKRQYDDVMDKYK